MRDTLSWIICIVCTSLISCAICLVIIAGISGLGYWAHQIDDIRGHDIRCDKEFDATVEIIAIVNETVRVIVERESYLIDSLPGFNITVGSNVIVYSSCEYKRCESKDDIQYEKKFSWTPPNADTSCSESIEMVVVVPICAVIVFIVGIVISIFLLCCTIGYFQKHYRTIDATFGIEKGCEKAKEEVEQKVDKLKTYPYYMENYEEV